MLTGYARTVACSQLYSTMSGSKNDIVFQSSTPVMFSKLKEKLGLTFHWKVWKLQQIVINSNGTLVCGSHKGEAPKNKIFKLEKVTISEMTNNYATEIERENGIVVNCQTLDGYNTSFRLILNEVELAAFKEALKVVTKEENYVDQGFRSSITGEVQKVKVTKMTPQNQSVMRRAIARAMDKYDKRSQKDRTLARRGAMKCLPVLFTSDLVHGSWWFVLGSLMFVITSAMLLVNSYVTYIGVSDSTLPTPLYQASWILMTVCGIFCTLGSMAFMRAVHEDPPMKPLFTWYHLQNDELLGSWLFLGANLPVVPYSLLYLSTAQSDWRYLGALFVSFILVIASVLFILCCYPSDKPRQKRIQPIAYACCCAFLSKEWMRTHLNNDWLAATWLVYWGTCFATVVCLALFLNAIADIHYLSLFMYGTGLLETAVFLVGSAYFVAGSYPEALSAADLDSAHSKHINIPTTRTGPVVGTGTGTGTGSTMSGALDADLEMNRNGSVLDAVSAPMHEHEDEDEDSP